ncbi:MAG: BatA domain-containing protein [Chloroflexi bacterium]|nr:BatA domain-containing protein [Chloroflexota bacterium]
MSGLGFITPALLGLSALAIPVFLLYMLRLRRTDMPISSTFLWQQLIRDREANAPWQRLRPNLLMLLQLLILAALVLALARPFAEVNTLTTGRIVLLLDASASMTATDMDGGQTRFEAAQKIALDTVNKLGSDDTMTVIRVSEVPEVLAAATRDRSVLKRAIRDARPSTVSADWQSALTLAAAGGRGVDNLRVVVLSDGGLPPNLPEIPGKVIYEEVGREDDNFALTALSVRALPDDSPQLFAQISNYGSSDVEVIFAVDLDDELFNALRYTVPAQSSIDVNMDDLPANFTRVKASISRPTGSNVPDYVESDNVGYAVFSPGGTGKALLVTNGNRFLDQIYSLQSGIELTTVTPDQGLPVGDYDLTILDSWLPTGDLPKGDLLVIDPPTSSPLFDVTGEGATPEIDAASGGLTDSDNPITRYVDFRTVNIRNFRTIARADWAKTIIQAADGSPLLLAGEFEGQQVAVLTFALQNSDLPLQLAWPILVSNLSEWYRPQRAISTAGDSLPPGSPITIRPTVEADAIEVERPDGEKATLELKDSAQVIYADTSETGLYKVEVKLGDDVVQKDAFAINLFDPTESAIAPREELTIGTAQGETRITSTAPEEKGRRELWMIIASVGLLILGIEWWYYHRNLSRKPKMLIGQSFRTNTKAAAPRWKIWAGRTR